MIYQLTIPAIQRRAEALFGGKSIVSRLADRTIQRSTYAGSLARARRLATGLRALGVRPGDRVATLCWNHARHVEAYFGVPLMGAVLHPLNLRLHPDDLAYIVNHADDRALLVDDVLLPTLDRFRDRLANVRIIAIGCEGQRAVTDIDYEELVGAHDVCVDDVVTDENQPAALCYTSGTTGRPKGVVYSHRNIALHGFGMIASTLLRESDTILAIVPMFHANGWGYPYVAALVGATQVLPGPHLDPASLLELMDGERVTYAAGVPTVWSGVLQALDNNPGKYDVSRVRELLVGGAPAAPALIRGLQERHGLSLLHAWGMTETGPAATFAHLPGDMLGESADAQYAYRARQGVPAPFIEVRARGGENALVPWDGESMGEIEVRGPWVIDGYYRAEGTDRFADDGWLKTGDIAAIDARGCIQIKDRSKDLIKSGGEWISSVALENALMDHPAVFEVAVIAVEHPKWDERPLAIVVLRPNTTTTADELRAFLAPRFAKWWLPDAFEFVPALPRTGTGKVVKHTLREQYRLHLIRRDEKAG